MSDRGRDTTPHLTEVRSVLGAAQHAVWVFDKMERRGYPDPDQADMRAALEECIRQLDRWRRTGRPLKSEG